MKTSKVLAVAVLGVSFALVGNAIAQVAGGFQGPGISDSTVADALKLPDDTPVVLKGNIEKSLGNEKYQFNSLAFNQCINQHSKKNGIKKGKIEDLLAEKLFVSSSAIHNWRFGSNGPASIELVKNIAKHLKIDYMTLLKRYKEIEEMGKFSTLQIESLKNSLEFDFSKLLHA